MDVQKYPSRSRTRPSRPYTVSSMPCSTQRTPARDSPRRSPFPQFGNDQSAGFRKSLRAVGRQQAGNGADQRAGVYTRPILATATRLESDRLLRHGFSSTRPVGHALGIGSADRHLPFPFSTFCYDQVRLSRETIGEDMRHHGLPDVTLFGTDRLGGRQREHLWQQG